MDTNNVDAKVKRAHALKEALQWFEAIAVAVIIALLIRGFLFEPVEVKGYSMKNTLDTGQRLILYKLGYYFSPPKAGDIIVLQYQEGMFKFVPFIGNIPFFKKMYPFSEEIDYIKRVIAVPGDTVDLKDGYVYINGEKIDEPYAKGKTLPKNAIKFPDTVPENKVFVLGDNRENSSDSRYIGYIDYKKIKGKAVFRFWPFKDIGGIK
jgi:signal peptidase I